ncbi:hypothetical protein KR026_000900 [Drosophila bipectinata]|nr:hypothetical protein KR026_000900 [Drosophila bipectinata]
MLVLRRLTRWGNKFSRKIHNLIDFAGAWPASERCAFEKDMRVLQDFVTAEEEQSLLQEIEPHLSRLPYETSHWDEAIHGYRETEQRNWNSRNRLILERISQLAFNGQAMPYVHVLDLAESGVIKPHVDSTRFCGDTIAGLSLLSDSVMRLVKISDAKIVPYSADLFLPRRSLYVMSCLARYHFTHEILVGDLATFQSKLILRKRRVSVICRNEP